MPDRERSTNTQNGLIPHKMNPDEPPDPEFPETKIGVFFPSTSRTLVYTVAYPLNSCCYTWCHATLKIVSVERAVAEVPPDEAALPFRRQSWVRPY